MGWKHMKTPDCTAWTGPHLGSDEHGRSSVQRAAVWFHGSDEEGWCVRGYVQLQVEFEHFKTWWFSPSGENITSSCTIEEFAGWIDQKKLKFYNAPSSYAEASKLWAHADKLPKGWEARIVKDGSSDHGLKYYVNTETGDSTWDSPLGKYDPKTSILRKIGDHGCCFHPQLIEGTQENQCLCRRTYSPTDRYDLQNTSPFTQEFHHNGETYRPISEEILRADGNILSMSKKLKKLTISVTKHEGEITELKLMFKQFQIQNNSSWFDWFGLSSKEQPELKNEEAQVSTKHLALPAITKRESSRDPQSAGPVVMDRILATSRR